MIADPSVPVGNYTVQIINKMEVSTKFPKGYKDKFSSNVSSMEMDVKSVVQKVMMGEADAGIVYKTDAAAMAKRRDYDDRDSL